MDGTIGATAPSGAVNTLGRAASTGIANGIGHGGDVGTGFHSRQPPSGHAVDTNTQHTENAETKTRLDESSEASNVSPFLPTFQKWSESPFTRYVARNASSGMLPGGIPSFKPVDRSKMGIPLNPFHIRNDTWSMRHEASIFTDPTTYFVAPRVMSKGAQSKQNLHREVYLDNETQPQSGSGPSHLGEGSDEVPMERGAGGVTGATESAPQGEMNIEASNPAKTEAPEGSQEGSKLEDGDTGVAPPKTEKEKGEKGEESEGEGSEPAKKKAKTTRIKAQTGKAKKDPKKVKTSAE